MPLKRRITPRRRRPNDPATPSPRQGLRTRPPSPSGPRGKGPRHGLCEGLERPPPPSAAAPGTTLTRATGEVLEALLWGFHNVHTGACFPSYEAIAAKAQCCRDTVCEAIKALALAGVLTWVNRIVRERVRERDLFGQWVTRWRVLRTSNAYAFRDPKETVSGGFPSTSENQTGTPNQKIHRYIRPVSRERIEEQTTAEMDRDALANRDRQLMALRAAMA